MRRCALILISVFLLAHSLPAQEPQSLRFTFMGDIMCHDVNFRMSDYRDIYRGVQDILVDDDLSVGNLEFPVDPTQPTAGYPFFNANIEYARAAIESGIDAFSVANNHSFDGREEGIFQTVRSLARLRAGADRPVAFSGIRGNPQASFLPQTLFVKGARIGFLAVTQMLNQTDRGRYVNVVDYTDRTDRERFLFLVRAVRPRYDILIVSYHGDREYSQEADPGKRAFFHQLAQYGADIVVGHHPHVVQGFEVLKRPGRDALLMYSMGNFISGMTWRLDPTSPADPISPTGESYLLSVDFDWAVRSPALGTVQSPALGTVQSPALGAVRSPVLGNGARFVLEGIKPIPIANYRNEHGEMVVARMSELASGAVKLPRAWTAYYAARLAEMEKFLSRFPIDADFASRAAAGLVP